MRFVARLALVIFLLACPPLAAAAEIVATSPPSLRPLAARLEQIDQRPLAAALAAAGLEMPPRIDVTLVPDEDALARQTPRWIVGWAFGTRDIIIFPDRIGSYPTDSLESTFTHEVAHLALTGAAGGGDLPRWFHEGVAVFVERGWGLGSEWRLLVATAREPTIADVNRLFRSEAQLASQEAYLLATVLVEDVGRHARRDWPGAVARRVAAGTPFARAFALETGTTPDAAAVRAWESYRRWTTWLALAGDPSAVWLLILTLASVAVFVRRRTNLRRRMRWAEDEGEW
jgi:hypothetical protein